jgi:hypothetical protein
MVNYYDFLRYEQSIINNQIHQLASQYLSSSNTNCYRLIFFDRFSQYSSKKEKVESANEEKASVY